MRERLGRLGPGALSEAELLGLVLAAGRIAPQRALAVACSLLEQFGGMAKLLTVGTAELTRQPGIGVARAASLLAIAEIARRLEATPLERGALVQSSADVHRHFGPLLAAERRELFLALLLDTKNRVLAPVRISEGSLAASLVHPREAFRPALREAAAAVIFVHNHPSGDPTPSREDELITDRLRQAGTLLGIPVLDHIVVARHSYHSFADNGW
jgi:DNA repair protein RadC